MEVAEMLSFENSMEYKVSSGYSETMDVISLVTADSEHVLSTAIALCSLVSKQVLYIACF